jgi:hypothetical protein
MQVILTINIFAVKAKRSVFMKSNTVKVFRVIMAFVVVISFTIVSCYYNDSLLGVWESEELVIELFENDRGTLNGTDVTWDLVLDDRCIMFFASNQEKVLFDYRLSSSGKKLILTIDEISFILTRK